ncbi:MAG: ABC transporter substrate-binding protein [Acidobacteria bacterium]|nr:ABC transporter substrate-binding protein [Acidobacteriota bacterium]
MKRTFIALGLTASMLAAAACQTTGPGAAGDKVRIGVFMSLTGSTAQFGISSTNGIKMAADEINAAGGVNGKQIELLVQDDRSDAQEAATIVTKFVTQDGVHGIIGEVASSRTIAAAPIAQNAKVPLLTPSSTNPEVTKKGDYIFRSCFIDPVQGAAMSQFAAKSLGKKRAALMVDRKNDYSTGLEKVINEVFPRLGGQVVITQSYQEGDTDFNGQLTSIKGADPDVIFIPGYYGDVALIAKQARDKGLNVPLVGGDGWDSAQLYTIGGASVVGSYFTNHYSPFDTDPKVQKFVQGYQQRYGQIPDALAATAYDAALIMFDAVKRANSLDGKAGKYVIQERVVVEGAAMPTGTGSGGANANASPVANTNAAGNANAGAGTNANANTAPANANASPVKP